MTEPSRREVLAWDRINVDHAQELRYWSRAFGVSPDALRKAVATVGSMAKDVERELLTAPFASGGTPQ